MEIVLYVQGALSIYIQLLHKKGTRLLGHIVYMAHHKIMMIWIQFKENEGHKTYNKRLIWTEQRILSHLVGL